MQANGGDKEAAKVSAQDPSEQPKKKPRIEKAEAAPKPSLAQWLRDTVPQVDISQGWPLFTTAHFPHLWGEDDEDEQNSAKNTEARYSCIEEVGTQPWYKAEHPTIREQLSRLQEEIVAADLALAERLRKYSDFVALDRTGMFPYKRVLMEYVRGEALLELPRTAQRPAVDAAGAAYLMEEADVAYCLFVRADNDGWCIVPMQAAVYKRMMAEVAFAPTKPRPKIEGEPTMHETGAGTSDPPPRGKKDEPIKLDESSDDEPTVFRTPEQKGTRERRSDPQPMPTIARVPTNADLNLHLQTLRERECEEDRRGNGSRKHGLFTHSVPNANPSKLNPLIVQRSREGYLVRRTPSRCRARRLRPDGLVVGCLADGALLDHSL